VSGSNNPAKLRAVVRRGIVNWAPPAIEGEDETSCRAHIVWMKKEKKKRQPNQAVVTKKMELTYSFRRQMLNEQKCLLKDIGEKYPFLFEINQVCPVCDAWLLTKKRFIYLSILSFILRIG
jgi:hypothetical protein